MDNVTVFYHDDMDGQLSAMAVIEKYRRQPDYRADAVNLVPWNGGEPYPDIPPTGQLCYMLDLTMDEDGYFGRLLDRCPVIRVDHHACAATQAKEKYGSRVKQAYLNDKPGYPSACVLCWRHLVIDKDSFRYPAIVDAAGLFAAGNDNEAVRGPILNRALEGEYAAFRSRRIPEP